MQDIIQIVDDAHILGMLKETPYPPKVLYIRGGLTVGTVDEDVLSKGQNAPPFKRITIVGSRQCSQYAKQVVDEICASLQGQPVSIVSGLARGVDTHAHTCALKYNLHTIAVVGSGLDDEVIYPHSNHRLAHQILKSGGALISEYEPRMRSQKWMFPARNRIMAGISDLVIIIEAKEKSGTLITSRLATDYNRDLMVIPNSIYSHYSKGSNELIKQGAYVYTKPEDIFHLLKLDFEECVTSKYTPTDNENFILTAIQSGHNKTQTILDTCPSQLTPSEVIQLLLNLEIENVIKRMDGVYVVL